MGTRLPRQHHRIGPVIGILIGLTLAGAELASAQVAVGAAVVNEDRYPARKVDFPGGVTGLPDLIYYHPSGFRGVMLDLYLPPARPR